MAGLRWSRQANRLATWVLAPRAAAMSAVAAGGQHAAGGVLVGAAGVAPHDRRSESLQVVHELAALHVTRLPKAIRPRVVDVDEVHAERHALEQALERRGLVGAAVDAAHQRPR